MALSKKVYQDIQVIVPYAPEKKLAQSYNIAMDYSPCEWVLFLDADVLLLNNHWYAMCMDAIEEVGDKTGWITATTNRIGAVQQKAGDAPASHDIAEHAKYSQFRYKKFGHAVIPIPGALSGFFILTSRSAWQKCGGFNERRRGLNGVDNDYSKALGLAGYKHYQLPGLYCYHIYKEKQVLLKW